MFKTRKRKFETALNVVISSHLRAVLDRIATEENMSIGEVTRELLEIGLNAKGIEY